MVQAQCHKDTPAEGEYASLVSQAHDCLTHGSIARATVSELFDRTSYVTHSLPTATAVTVSQVFPLIQNLIRTTLHF